MSIGKNDFKMMIEERIEDERKVAGMLHDSVKKTENPIIKLLLYQLALDSAKHEHMLRTILHLSESPTEQFKNEGQEFRKTIENHAELEHEMLEGFEKIVDKTKDKRIRFILQDIISDEKKHHAIMRHVYELVSESEKAQDEKWWDFLYRYSRLSG